LFSEYNSVANESIGDTLNTVTDNEKIEFEKEYGLSFFPIRDKHERSRACPPVC
jgi:hypothetical protein